jgi:POT family proton-dependent oligopeptide transporter
VHKQEIKTLDSGEVVIVDPGQTIQSMMMVRLILPFDLSRLAFVLRLRLVVSHPAVQNFYWAINIGSLLQLATTYSEKDVGYWLAYLIPLIIYMLCPLALWFVASKLILYPPQGTVILDAGRVLGIAIKKRSWNAAKPSVIEAMPEEKRPSKHYKQWDDEFIGELQVAFKACKLFLFLVVFNIADAGLNSILTSMAASMTTNGAPNDLLLNLNSATIIVLVPAMNYGLYPLLRKYNINFSPIKRITFGFVLAGLGMVASAILQWKVYVTSPCGYFASTTCKVGTGVSPISVWAQVRPRALPYVHLLVAPG